MPNNLERRDFLKVAGAGSLAAFGSPAPGAAMIPGETSSAIKDLEPMKITKVEAVRFRKGLTIDGEPPAWTWVRLHTDTGLMGVGETYPMTNSQIGTLRDLISSYHGSPAGLLGSDPRDIERTWWDIYNQTAFYVTGGAEMRVLSAINIAQWDILGKALGVPVYRLLGGKTREKIRVYNTYTHGWTINHWQMDTDAVKVVSFLNDRGIKGIKFYPFDPISRRNGGTYISPADIDSALKPIKQIRDKFADDFEIAIDVNAQWNLTSALRIARALEPYKIMWLEDVLDQGNMESYSILRNETSVPITISERLATRFQFREALVRKAVGILMYDVTWCGGISEAMKISALADTWYIPTAPHTCGGPLLWFASTHVATAIKNLWIMESCYHFYNYQYPYFIKNVPVPENGFVKAPEGPGLGVDFRAEPFDRGDAIVETIAEI
ncbi:MAG: mandelate racemase/muconate lactonizing enzyme family protein [Terriglobia bacterium]